MAFPGSPTDGQQHTEGNKNYVYNAAGAVWLVEDASGAGATNITAVESPTGVEIQSSSGTNDTIDLATGTNAGAMDPADKTKLDGIETAATADQTAAEVVVTPSGNLTSSDVQAALVELQGDVDGLGSVTGNFVGQVSTSAALDALVDPDTGSAPVDGDLAFLDTDEGGRQAGFYLRSAGVWGATPMFQVPDTFVAADATTADNLAGDGGAAITYARSDHRHAQSRSATLPATDGSGGVEHVLVGHGSLPDGKYVLIGTVWVQV